MTARRKSGPSDFEKERIAAPVGVMAIDAGLGPDGGVVAALGQPIPVVALDA